MTEKLTEKLPADVAVIGAGLGGSLTALLLNRIGLRVAPFDRGSHPRFAIGESSTPIADLVLRDLSRRYDLPRLEPLSRSGTWKTNCPHLVCGLKRGFSFFQHEPNEHFVPSTNHRNQLLVAASSEDARADTHWHDVLAAKGADLAAHPFRCDAAALHPLLDEGWMWQLRFDNGVTSAGFAIDSRRQPLNPSISPQQEWDELLVRYPSIGEQFAGARLVAPQRGLCRTGRLQRRWMQAADVDWAMLPHTAGFIDPLYSSGLAHTLCGVERLVYILERHWSRESLSEQLQHYAQTVQAELTLT